MFVSIIASQISVLTFSLALNIVLAYFLYVNLPSSSFHQTISFDCQRTVKEYVIDGRQSESIDIWKTGNAKKCDVQRSNLTSWSLNYWSDHPDAKGYGCKSLEYINWALELRNKERKIYSQNGEDGIIEAIFDKIGVAKKFFVEFGVQNGSECNTRLLREQNGWKGVMFDNNNNNPLIGLYQESVWVDNVVQLFQKYNVPSSFDLFSLDVNFGDFWILRELLVAGYRPRAIVVEVNRAIGPYASFTVPQKDAENHVMFQSNRWFGASVSALEKLVHKFGYQLIYVEKQVINAFFVKSSEINNSELGRIFWQRNLLEGVGSFAHPEDEQNRPFEHICETLPCDSTDDW